MKTITMLTLAAACAVSLLGGGVATAAGASCSATGAGGQKAPKLNAGKTGILENGTGGYNCTVQWNAVDTPQYESGGTWHSVTDIFGFSHPSPGVYFGANTGHNWTDGVYVPSGTDPDTPVCGFNWRYSVQFLNPSLGDFQDTVSPQLAKTC